MKNFKMLLAALILSLGLAIPATQDVSAAALKAKISTSCGTTASVGDAITINGSSTGGSGTKTYRYRYKLNGKMYTIKGYSNTKKVTYTIKKNGTYKFYVYAKAKNKVATATKTVKVAKLSASLKVKSNYYVNNKVTMTASSSGGSGAKQYQFSYTYNGSTVSLKNFSKTKTCTFTPQEEGTYKCLMTCKDEKGATVTKTSSVKVTEIDEAEMALRQKLVDTAVDWLGVKEGSAKHKEIISIYNSEKNNMYINGKYSHYKASTKDSWCDIFVSACFIKSGYKVISGVECGCERHINLLNKKLCSWVEDDAYVPTMGDIIFYDWDDNGKGDCTGHSDHVGIVVSVDGNKIKVIEGNKSGSPDRVGYRNVTVNQRYIRGYGVPKYLDLL
jgi:hypothetical protein